MPITLYALSGSPYAWRVWLALEHKRIPYTLKPMSFDAGDFRDPAFARLNPRRRVPVIVDDGFVLYESAAIVEYLDERQPGPPHLFPGDLRERALQRRLIREADQYFATALEHLVDAVLFTPSAQVPDDRIAALHDDLRQELRQWELCVGDAFLAGPLSAADFTLYPEVALMQRLVRRRPAAGDADIVGPRVASWCARMAALPLVQRTWPPHWSA